MKAYDLSPVISRRGLWILATFLVLESLVLGAVLAELDAFDLVYAFTRAHEDWEADEIILTLLVAIVSLVLVFALLSVRLARAVVRASRRHLELERKLAMDRKQLAMGTMLGGIAHAMNNNLQPIISLSEAVRDELPDGSEHARDLDRILQAATSSREILAQVLGVARSSTGPEFDDRCAARETILRALNLARVALPNRIRLSTRLEPETETCVVALSKSNLETIVLNLVNNGRDALKGMEGGIEVGLDLAAPAPPGARIEMLDHPWLCLSVTDQGKGMDEPERARAFDLFYTTKDVHEGTGIGLSEVLSLVKGAGGDVELSSAPGKGTRVAVYLPYSEFTGGRHGEVDSDR
ncbi:integral membrane sensor signal transduction histidine kinase [Thiorhodococcus drewsii AZ1]|uniref:histidine kinase n=1 Tax=Thiorhodococcus drewsii AZ1 TaxID=765913 RepID=G2DZD5_9GAMM|nr:integral membrane sensor signal transduction histidine kinase [Thiorhodococcus drewsii AZ1]